MKLKYIILTIGFIVLICVVLVYKFFTHFDYTDCEKEIKERYNYEFSSNPDNYISDCLEETKDGIKFPLDEPAYAILHYDKLKLDKTLKTEQLIKLLTLLNDTSTYEWGEVGTPYFDRIVTFHDKAGRCIGLTKISYDGQTYSTPTIAKMKYGGLQADNVNKFIEILEEN